ncbi:unnamed protein product [Prunus armeniaca]|uniref:60S ribosomal export protein NMD3 n=1 Tax=Prunus armeniaca TaxID=36596 RepID=A0A6J5WFP2_PRUAR|nr:unnamed protein product [Prunus armeniaca]
MAEEAGMFMVHQTVGSVLCCKCGIPMAPNAANMCVKCLRSEVDITEGLQKHVTIVHCPECDCYLQPPRTWIKAQLESKELLTFCVKRLKNLNKVRLVHAEFIWTEPHSKRIKVKLKVQKEVLNGAILEQSYVVEYVQQEHMCESCSRVQANPDQWVASVQLRQHVSHRRTFFYLEQLILRHGAAASAIKIKQMEQGIDFFFANRSHGVKFVEFVGKVAPVRSRSDKQLVSHDSKSNNYNYKHTFSVEISPICREDLICLPPKVRSSLGNLGPLVICTKVTNSIALFDPFTLRHCFLDTDQYWRYSFKSLHTSRELVEYIVLDIEIISPEVNVGGSSNDDELEKYRGLVIPDAILIKKSYEEKRQKKHAKARPWKLKSLGMEVDDKAKLDQEKVDSEYEQFLKDLEENPEMRLNISLYHNEEYQPSEMASMTDGEDAPSVPLEELLADLELRDGEDEDDSSMRE